MVFFWFFFCGFPGWKSTPGCCFKPHDHTPTTFLIKISNCKGFIIIFFLNFNGEQTTTKLYLTPLDLTRMVNIIIKNTWINVLSFSGWLFFCHVLCTLKTILTMNKFADCRWRAVSNKFFSSIWSYQQEKFENSI